MERNSRWEKGQAILHVRDDKKPVFSNAYGSFRYAGEEKKENKTDHKKEKQREGFVLEAREAPGTRVHTQMEKHLSLESMKRVKNGKERFLYTSELPFRNQSFFYDVAEKKKSRELLDCMKCMLKEQGHDVLRDLFGFLEQEPERLRKQMLEKERLQELTPEGFGRINKEIDRLDDRLRKKEAREHQLCNELQLMIDRRERGKSERPGDWKQKAGSILPKKEPEQEGSEENTENKNQNEDEEGKSLHNNV